MVAPPPGDFRVLRGRQPFNMRKIGLLMGALALQPGWSDAQTSRYAPYPAVEQLAEGISWPKGQALPHRRPVRVLIGKPIRMDHMDGKEIVAEIDRMLRAMLAELRAKEAASRSRV